MKSGKLGFVTIVGLSVAAAGVIAPILWDRYETRSALELHHVANIRLIERARLPEKIQLSYEGRPVTTLSRLTFSLINSGRTPILQRDLIIPPTISFEADVGLLDVIQDAATPEDLEIKYTRDTSDNSIVISFPLMNPGDQVQFGVLLAGISEDFGVKARVVGVNRLELVDRVDEFREIKRKTGAGAYVVGVFASLLLLVVIMGGGPEYLEERRIKLAIARDAFPIPQGSTREHYLRFVRTTFRRKTWRELLRLTRFIDSVGTDPVTKDQHRQIAQRITEYAGKMNVIPSVTVLGGLSCLGLLYFLWRVL